MFLQFCHLGIWLLLNSAMQQYIHVAENIFQQMCKFCHQYICVNRNVHCSTTSKLWTSQTDHFHTVHVEAILTYRQCCLVWSDNVKETSVVFCSFLYPFLCHFLGSSNFPRFLCVTLQPHNIVITQKCYPVIDKCHKQHS